MITGLPAIDEYARSLGIEEEALPAAVSFAQWSAAEYRILAPHSILVEEIPWKEIDPFQGRGLMPVIEEAQLQDLLGIV